MADRSLPVRALWFLAAGWWATPIVVNAAWALTATVVLIPVGIAVINFVPTVLTLREPASVADPERGRGQHGPLVRAVYFLLVGWWAGFLWANVASLFAITIVGLPVAIQCSTGSRTSRRCTGSTAEPRFEFGLGLGFESRGRARRFVRFAPAVGRVFQRRPPAAGRGT